MILKKFILNPVLPKVSGRLVAHIQQYAQTELTQPEIEYISAAYSLFDEYMNRCLINEGATCVVLFVDRTIEIELSPTSQGQYLPLVVVQIGNIREFQCSLTGFVLLEELCHCLYQIRNEYKVKQVVLEVLQQNDKTLTLHGLWPHMFDDGGRPIFLAQYANDYHELA